MFLKRLLALAFLVCIVLTFVAGNLAVYSPDARPFVAMVVIDVLFGWALNRRARRGVSPVGVILLLVTVVGLAAATSYILSLIGPWFTLAGIGIAGIATIAFSINRQNKMIPLGCCQSCGYDLRESHDRCPECGVVPIDLERRRRIRAELIAKRAANPV